MTVKRLVGAVRVLVEMAALGSTKLGFAERYLIAFVLIALATVLRFLIAPQEAGLPYVTYFPAATLAAVFGGIGAGLFATVLGALIAAFLFIPPFGEVKFASEAVVSALVFCADELVVCTAIEAMRRYYKGYAEAVAETERAHATERRARLEAERANEAKSRFLAAASHDLRQPYQALRLFLAALENPNLGRAEIDAIVARMDLAMSGGEELLQSLLDLSTLDAGVVAPRFAEIAVRDFLAAIEARHRPVAEDKGLTFRVRSRDESLQSDPVLLGRLLDNLVANAIRYTERGGVLVAYRHVGGRAAFEVWDSGIGIAPEHQEAIFEEFFQVANPERDRRRGAGLGLAVVSKTAHLLDAEVTVRSRLGRGTVFRLVLPRAGVKRSEVPPSPAVQAA